MMNFLTDVSTSTSSFDMDMLWAVLLIFVPILFGLIAAKTWNVVHGIITYLLFSFLIVYLLDLDVLTKIFSEGSWMDYGFGMLYNPYIEYSLAGNLPVTFIWEQLAGIEALSDMLTGDAGIHIMLAVHVVLFIISQVIGSMFRRNR